MALNVTGIFDALVSHAMASGLFERVNQHEPKNAPGNGLTAAVWAQSIGPTRRSGLAATSGRIEFRLRIYSNMVQEPQDAIDPNILAAVDTLMAAYSGDFELGGLVREVDLLGEHGTSLSAVAGYLNQDGRLYRVMDIVLPVVVNDIWTQAA